MRDDTHSEAAGEIAGGPLSHSRIPQKTQENHAGQHSWPNLFLGRWLKVLP
jgi:hypothetical protein